MSEGTASPDAALAAELFDDVRGLVPEMKERMVREVISTVMDSAGGLTQEVESHFAVGKRTLDVNAVIAIMVQGALAEVCEGHPDDDVRGRIYRAGRKVGDFMTKRWARKIQEGVDAERKATES